MGRAEDWKDFDLPGQMRLVLNDLDLLFELRRKDREAAKARKIRIKMTQIEQLVVAIAAAVATAVLAAVGWFAKLAPWRRKVDREIALLGRQMEEVADDIQSIKTNHLPHIYQQTQETDRKVTQVLGILEGEDRERRRARAES